MLAGGVVENASAAPFDEGHALDCMVRRGVRPSRDRHRAGPLRLGVDDEAALHHSAERPNAVLALDGVIHNLPDLRGETGGFDHPLMSLIARRGADALDRVVGDMSCAWWDGDSRTLILARDPGGYRPLFYWQGEGVLLFASEPRGLFGDDRPPRRLDEAFLGEWLAILPRPSGRTAFQGVQRVPPGHALVWLDGKIRLHRFWRPEARPMLRLKRSEDYAEALRETLRSAVKDCLPGSGDVASHLSAGLDSSSVTALAAEALGEQGRRLIAYTAVPRSRPDQPLPANRLGDEGPLAAATARRYANVNHQLIANDTQSVMRVLDRRAAAMDCPVRNPSHCAWLDAINADAEKRGVRVMLTAGLGNLTISHDGRLAPAQMLAQGRLASLFRLLADIHRRDGDSALVLAGRTLEPFLPVGMKYAIRRLFGRRGALDLEAHSAISPTFAAEQGLRARSDAIAGDLRNPYGLDGRAGRLAILDRTDHRGLWRAATRRLYGLDIRDPTADRRLLDLCLSIPDEHFVSGGGHRALIRRAMRDHLPVEVLEERRRGLQSADWPVGLTAARREIADEIARLRQSVGAGKLLDLARLQTMIQTWPEGDSWARHDVVWGYQSGLSRAVAVGRFVRQIEGGNA